MTSAEAKARLRAILEQQEIDREKERLTGRKPRQVSEFGTEAKETAKVIQWLMAHNITHFGVPNAGKRSYAAANALKAQGMSKGVPDIIIATPPPCGGYGAAAIEMKKLSGGALSVEQFNWLRRLERCGWATNACAGSGEAIGWLESLGYGR